MAEELISVIVPVYGAEAFLDKCVKSILNQTYQNLEIILVDDGSKDRSGQMCDEYSMQDSRIKVIHKENGGLMSAWMAGVGISTGSYLFFVDSDDWIEAPMISEMAVHISGGNEIICSNCLIEHTDGRLVPVYHGAAPGDYKGEELEKTIKENILGNENRIITMSRCMKLTKRNLIVDNLGYCDTRIRMAEDVNIMLPAMLDAERIVVMEGAAYYHYYANDESMTHYYDKTLSANMTYLSDAIDKIMKDKYHGNNAELIVEKEKLLLFMLQIKNEFRKDEKGAVRRVSELMKSHDIKRRALSTPLELKELQNRVLYTVMRHPSVLTICMALVAFKVKNS